MGNSPRVHNGKRSDAVDPETEKTICERLSAADKELKTDAV